MTGTLQQINEPNDIAVNIGIGILKRITHSGLSRQIDNNIELFSLTQLLQLLTILQTHFHETVGQEFVALNQKAILDLLFQDTSLF